MTQHNQSAAETLRKARALLAEGKWCKGSYAVDRYGVECDEKGPAAVAWCAFGAVLKVEPGPLRQTAAENVLNISAASKFNNSAVHLNDDPTTTLADVLALYDRAIEIAEKEAEE